MKIINFCKLCFVTTGDETHYSQFTIAFTVSIFIFRVHFLFIFILLKFNPFVWACSVKLFFFCLTFETMNISSAIERVDDIKIDSKSEHYEQWDTIRFFFFFLLYFLIKEKFISRDSVSGQCPFYIILYETVLSTLARACASMICSQLRKLLITSHFVFLVTES